MSNMDIAKTIMTQLGGNKFRVMTGAKNFTAIDGGLSFSIPGGGGFAKAGINNIQIILGGDDLYTMAFRKIAKQKVKEIAKHEGIYFDQLQEIFTKETGLYTRL